MKIVLFALLCASLAANAYWLLHGPELSPSAIATTAPADTLSLPEEEPAPRLPSDFVKRVAAGDATLLPELQALGLPEHLVRALLTAQISLQFEERLKALRPDFSKIPFWASERVYREQWTASRRSEILEIERERLALMKSILGPDYAPPSRVRDARTFPLTGSKAQMVQMLEDDYSAMKMEIAGNSSQIKFPEDQEKLAYIEKERRAELASLLTPEELFEYDVRHSTTAMMLRHQLQAMGASEAEFRELFKAYQNIDEKLGPSSGTQEYFEKRNKLIAEAEPQLKALLGEARFEDYKRSQDYDYRRLYQIAQRLELPADKVNQAYALKASVEKQLTAIRTNPDARDPAKRQALQANLAKETEAALVSILGAEGADAFKENANLLRRINPPTR